jgi:hypothetical protein
MIWRISVNFAANWSRSVVRQPQNVDILFEIHYCGMAARNDDAKVKKYFIIFFDNNQSIEL